MAVVRARTAPPYALVISVVLCVLFAGAAIFTYVLYSKTVVDQQDATDKLSRVASDLDIRNANASPTGGPALRQVLAQNQQLKELIMGANATGSVESIKGDPTISASIDRDHSLVGAIKSLTATRDQQATDLVAANERAKSATGESAAAEQNVKKLTDSYEATIAQLQDQLKTAQEQVAAANGSRDKGVSDSLDKIKAMQQSSEDDRRNLVLQNQDLQSKVTDLQKQVQELKIAVGKARGSGSGPTEIAQADGSVLHVNAAAGEVYISLTSSDHIKPGMTFSCYDPRSGVRLGNDEGAKGNGTLEVMQVRADSSICRITSTTPGHAIQQGDLIFNVVYHNDTARKFHFVVFGDFDLDGDGIATAAERDRLISMINTWGGQVDDKVTAQTDYVVMGTRPATPTIIEDNSTATAPGSVASERVSDDARYDQIIKEGKELGIPVLNANRFLSLIGYYSTTIVRY